MMQYVFFLLSAIPYSLILFPLGLVPMLWGVVAQAAFLLLGMSSLLYNISRKDRE
jgi:hypothetical protein